MSTWGSSGQPSQTWIEHHSASLVHDCGHRRQRPLDTRIEEIHASLPISDELRVCVFFHFDCFVRHNKFTRHSRNPVRRLTFLAAPESTVSSRISQTNSTTFNSLFPSSSSLVSNKLFFLSEFVHIHLLLLCINFTRFVCLFCFNSTLLVLGICRH